MIIDIEFTGNAEVSIEEMRRDLAVESEREVALIALARLGYLIKKAKEGYSLQLLKDNDVEVLPVLPVIAPPLLPEPQSDPVNDAV